jgi:hypothetical protein
VYYKHRPALLGTPPALRLLDDRVKQFEADLTAAEVREAIDQKDFSAATRHLSTLNERRGGASVRIARMLAHWTPNLLWRAYKAKRRRRATAPHALTR